MSVPVSNEPERAADTAGPGSAAPDLRISEVPARADRLHRVRRALTVWTAQTGMAEEQAIDLVFVVDEAMTNVVRHAYPKVPGVFDVQARYKSEPRQVTVTVTDYGCWRPPETGRRARGLALLAALTTAVVVTRTSRGTTVHMIWTL
ncbi:ATP-binding protein [Amycolatopsis sp. NPDC059657]|uniref:ATP-binding protein n=1 Tax=Amycolatopsis sp. NPDC059657 TaxID=3346899 RepID=UPI0036723453